MLKKVLTTLSVLLAALIMFSCSDRGDNVIKPNYDVRDGFESVFSLEGGHSIPRYLAFSMFNSVALSPKLDVKVYIPKDYPEDGNTYPHPVLFLLSPFQGNAQYYLNHGLSAIADRMIESGEIVPMIIVCVDGSHGYGATFYGNSYAGGKYSGAIGDDNGSMVDGSILDWVKGAFKTDTSRMAWGVSGFEMGGYGAMRVGVEYSENFGSISAVSAPLDFDGSDGAGGFVAQFENIMAELDGDYKSMDTSSAHPLRTMLMGAACSFSPHVDFANPVWFGDPPHATDTIIFDDTLSMFQPEGFASSVAFHLPFDENGNIPDTLIYAVYYDSTITIDTLLIPPDTTIIVDTVYDTCGYYDSIWGMWLNNNIESLLSNDPAALDSTDIKLFTLSSDEYDFNQQTVDFAAFLTSYLAGRGVSSDLTPLEIDGYPGYDATVGRFTYDILPAILKFHSDAFSGQ